MLGVGKMFQRKKLNFYRDKILFKSGKDYGRHLRLTESQRGREFDTHKEKIGKPKSKSLK